MSQNVLLFTIMNFPYLIINNKMKNLTPKQKRNLLAELITLKSSCGYCIAGYMGKPLSNFDFEKIQNSINKFALEFEEINGCEYSFTYSSLNK